MRPIDHQVRSTADGTTSAPARIVCPAPLQAAMLAAARAAAPIEFIGALGGRWSEDELRLERFEPLPNLAAAPDRFDADPAAFTRACASLLAAAAPFVGFAHSHPDGRAWPSARDRSALWAGCAQLIIGLGEEPPRVRAFWNGGAGLAEVPLRQ